MRVLAASFVLSPGMTAMVNDAAPVNACFVTVSWALWTETSLASIDVFLRPIPWVRVLSTGAPDIGSKCFAPQEEARG